VGNRTESLSRSRLISSWFLASSKMLSEQSLSCLPYKSKELSATCFCFWTCLYEFSNWSIRHLKLQGINSELNRMKRLLRVKMLLILLNTFTGH
jgi:hypothetical protein